MSSFKIWLFIGAATIGIQQSIRTQSYQTASGEEKDCSTNTFADSTQAITQNAPTCESKEACELAPSLGKCGSCGQAGIGE